MPEKVDYKEEQRKSKQIATLARILYTGRVPLIMGIKQFKRDNPKRTDAHQAYKERVWAEMGLPKTKKKKKTGDS